MDKDSKIIASSRFEYLSKYFNTLKLMQERNSYTIIGEYLYIYSPIYASFERTKIGYLVLKYNLKNLKMYLTYQDGMHSYIVDKKSSLQIGDYIDLGLKLDKEEDNKINDDHVIVYKKFSSMLKDFYIIYAVDKAVALKILYDFTKFILSISVFIILVIIYLSLRYSKGIVRPIENLTLATDKITKEHDYSSRLEVNSQDEIATLTDSFNKMLETTSLALESLEKENKLRLQRFIQLIEVFNIIIQTKNEQECIDISIKEIKKLTQKRDLYFQKEKKENSIDIYVTNFEEEKKSILVQYL
ncbi:MAG: HAMP domain-containing protein [Sulfurimonas sp.]|nr:HAMP domain-containing protein [Sulfurimonas sp.]